MKSRWEYRFNRLCYEIVMKDGISMIYLKLRAILMELLPSSVYALKYVSSLVLVHRMYFVNFNCLASFSCLVSCWSDFFTVEKTKVTTEEDHKDSSQDCLESNIGTLCTTLAL